MKRLRAWAAALKRDVIILWIAARDPRTPLLAKLLALAFAAYLLSPIDLIPDFIPVLGLLDDIIIAPIGIWLVLRAIPTDLRNIFRAQADAQNLRLPASPAGLAMIVSIWLCLLIAAGLWLARLWV